MARNNGLGALPFGLIVRKLRERTPKLTQEELAALVQLDSRTIQTWEAGERQPNLDNLKKLTKVFVSRYKFTKGQEKEEAALLWSKVGRSANFDREWFDELLQASNQPVEVVATSAQLPQINELPPSKNQELQLSVATGQELSQSFGEPSQAVTFKPEQDQQVIPVEPTFSEMTQPENPGSVGSFLKPGATRLKLGLIAAGMLLFLIIAGVIVYALLQNHPNSTAALTSTPGNTISSNYYSNMNLLTTLTGHSLAVNQVVYSPDGTLLFSASGDKTIKVWRIGKGQPTNPEPLANLNGHTDYAYAVAVSANGKVLASTGKDQQIIIWELDKNGVPTGKILKTLQNNTAEGWSISLSPDGMYLAVPGANSAIEVWDLTTYTSFELTGHKKKLREVRFSPDGKLLATASEDGTARLWSLATKQAVQTFSGHSDVVSTVAFSPNGKFLVSGSEDNSLIVWDINGGKALQTLKGHTNKVYGVAISPDSLYVASTGADRTIRLWEVQTGRLIDTLQASTNASVVTLSFSPDGRVLASGSEVPDHTIKFWGGLP